MGHGRPVRLFGEQGVFLFARFSKALFVHIAEWAFGRENSLSMLGNSAYMRLLVTFCA